jgi:aminodeoxyfutalosine deaminase
VAAGVACSVSTDDPAMFGTDLSADYAAAGQLGVPVRDCYQAGLRGALCDQRTRHELQQIGEAFNWPGSPPDSHMHAAGVIALCCVIGKVG